jgi:hypothetical protein
MLHVTCCGAAHLNRHPADLSKSNVRFCVLSWFVLVTAISLVPLPAKIFLHTVGRWHDCDHLFVFFVTGALVLFGAPRVSSRAQRTMSILAFCAALEGIQAFAYHNRFEWHDLWIDYLAIFSSWAVMIVVGPLLSASKPEVRPIPGLPLICTSTPREEG